jgi:hypothetical protein
VQAVKRIARCTSGIRHVALDTSNTRHPAAHA